MCNGKYNIKINKKSKEAFMMAIEVYNKPTIHYRVEGFSFFICNAWELMLKAHIINKYGENKIYYMDSPNRTISLEKSISMIFINSKSPLRLNLEKIIELRNTSTHFITTDINKATSVVKIDSSSKTAVTIIKELKDHNETHKYNQKKCVKEIKSRLKKLDINMDTNSEKSIEFNKYDFDLFAKYFEFKDNPRYCYIYKVGSCPTYSYSIQTIDLIVEEIKKNPDKIIQDLKEKLKNKPTPGAKEFLVI